MDNDPVFEKLSQLLTKILGKGIGPIQLDAKLIDDYGADSMDMVELADRAEEIFQIHFATEDIPSLITVEDLLSYVKGRIPANQP